MYWIALKMLTGDRAKYLGLIAGILFATLLMSQQVSIFTGIMARTGNQIRDFSQVDLWVMHPEVQYLEEIKPLPDKELIRVRSVDGVDWALPLYKGMAVARGDGGVMQQIIVMGVDNATLTGRPPKMMTGKWEDLKQTQSIIIDRAGYEFFWPGESQRPGHTLEINDQRAVVVGICDASPPFMTFPVVYTRYSEALRFSPGERNRMSFVLVKVKPDQNIVDVQRRIHAHTGLQVLTGNEFKWHNIMYILKHTGIAINFGTTVLLGFIIGSVIAGQTFYIFIIENLRQFGTLKALGVSNGQILGMVFTQALVAGFIGFGLGIGLCAIFFSLLSDTIAMRGFILPWQVVVITGIAVSVIIAVASIFSIRKALVVDPALVFRG